MEKKRASDVSRTISESAAGAVRLVTLRLTGDQTELAAKSKNFGRHISFFLDKEVRDPFRYKQLSKTSFALNGRCEPSIFDRYCMDIHERLVEFLFGSEGRAPFELIVFAGSEEEVAKFIIEPEKDAIERSKTYLKRVLARLEDEDEENAGCQDLPPIQQVSGKRRLLYRGILACRQSVLVAYAITPSASEAPDPPGVRPQDIDLARYLSFRGTEAVDYSIRVFDKASYLIQTGGRSMRSIIVLIPVSYKTLLSNSEKDRFLANLDDHPEWVRDQLFLSIFDTPPRPGSSIIQRMTTELHQYFRTIDWQVTTPHIDPSLFAGCNIHSITLDMRAHKINRRKIIQQFAQKIPEMKDMRIRPAITNIDTREELELTMRCRITYASGDAVTAPLPNCAPAQKVDFQDLPILEPTVLEAGSDAA